nr:EVE domain-containing protein [Bacteroidota bacterium]
DPTTDDTAWSVVEIAPFKKLKRSVTLAEIKADKKLEGIELVRLSRLSVAVIKPNEFDRIMELSESK